MTSQAKLNLHLNLNAVGKNMSVTSQNFRSNSQQPTSTQQQQQLINQIYSNQSASMRAALNKGESTKNVNNNNNNSANSHMFQSIGHNKMSNVITNKELEHINQQIHQQDQEQRHQQLASTTNTPQVTLSYVLGQTSNTRKSVQHKSNNDSLGAEFKNQKRLSYSQKALNFSPTNINKPRQNHINIGANFQQSQRNSLSNNIASSNPSSNSHQQTLIQQIQQQSNNTQQNNNQSQSPYSSNSNNLSIPSGQQHQVTFQHAKGLFSPMKSFFKSQNSLDFSSNPQVQFNKTFQIQPHTSSANPNSLQQLYQQQFPQQPQQVLSAKNKDFKGPFFFPTSNKNKQVISMNHINNSITNNTNNNNSNNMNASNANKTIKKTSIHDLSNITSSLQSQFQHQLYSNTNVDTSNAKGSSSNLDMNLLKLEREQLRERIEKLEQEKNDLNTMLKRQSQVKDLAISQLKRLVEQKLSINNIEQECYKNIMQLDLQYSSEALTPESLTFLPKQSPKGKTLTDFRKIFNDKQPSDDTQINSSKAPQFNFSIQRSSLPSSPKRKIHFDKIKDKVIQIGQFDYISPSKKKLINHDNVNKTTNATGTNLSHNMTQYNNNQLAHQGTSSTSNTIIYNQKQSSEDNTKNTSQIIGLIQPVVFEMDNKIQLELQKIKERMMEVLKLKSSCPICSKKCIQSSQRKRSHIQDQSEQEQLQNEEIDNKLKINLQRKSECINMNDINKKIINQENEKDKIKSYR